MENSKKNTKQWVEIGTVRWRDLIIDPTVQRDQERGEINAIAGDFDPDALGTITVSVRANGDKVLLDGQQRMNAALIAEYDEPINANLHYGLTHAQEAALFRRLNYRRVVNATTLFNVACVEGNRMALAIQAVLSEYRISVGGPNGFKAIAAAMRIASTSDGLLAFKWALDVVNQVWGAQGKNLDGRMIEGLALWYNRDSAQIDTNSLREKLAQRKGGLHGIIGDARTTQQLRGGKLVTGVIDILIAEYNKNKKKNMLPEWQR